MGAVMLSCSLPYKLLRLQGFLVTPPFPIVLPLNGPVWRVHFYRTESTSWWKVGIFKHLGKLQSSWKGILAIRIDSLKSWYPITPIVSNVLRNLNLLGFQSPTCHQLWVFKPSLMMLIIILVQYHLFPVIRGYSVQFFSNRTQSYVFQIFKLIFKQQLFSPHCPSL